MKSINEMPEAVRSQVRYVLTDIDDTLTNQGRMSATAYAALARLHEAGFLVVPVTGRPAGWCDHIARMWPVDGVVGENGAFYFRYDEEKRVMVRCYAKEAEQRVEDERKLAELGRKIVREVPGCAISVDQAYREADLAVDFCEDVPALPDADIQRINELFEEAGANAKISSIHVNGWFGEYDKLSMTRRFFKDVVGKNLEDIREQVVFSGDSPNDAPMFDYFPNSVGVANVSDFIGQLDAEPTWICPSRGGKGFAELAEVLLQRK